MIQKWNTQWKKLCRLFCLYEIAVLILIFYSYNSVSDLRFSLVVEQCNSKQVCCRKTIETTQFFSLSVSLFYHRVRRVPISRRNIFLGHPMYYTLQRTTVKMWFFMHRVQQSTLKTIRRSSVENNYNLYDVRGQFIFMYF